MSATDTQNGDCTFDDVTFSIENNGVKASYPLDGSCTLPTMGVPGVDDATYEAIQFHVHTRSEHTFDEQQFAAELHIVHRAVGTDIEDIGIDFDKLGITFSIGIPNPLKPKPAEPNFPLSVLGLNIEASSSTDNVIFERFLEYWKAAAEDVDAVCNINGAPTGGNPVPATLGVDAYNLRSPNTAFFQYEGGLTTPPCSGTCRFFLIFVPLLLLRCRQQI